MWNLRPARSHKLTLKVTRHQSESHTFGDDKIGGDSSPSCDGTVLINIV